MLVSVRRGLRRFAVLVLKLLQYIYDIVRLIDLERLLRSIPADPHP